MIFMNEGMRWRDRALVAARLIDVGECVSKPFRSSSPSDRPAPVQAYHCSLLSGGVVVCLADCVTFEPMRVRRRKCPGSTFDAELARGVIRPVGIRKMRASDHHEIELAVLY